MESCCFTYLGAHFSLAAPASGPLITYLSEGNLKSLIASHLEENYITEGAGLEGRMHLMDNDLELSGAVANIQALRFHAGHEEAGRVHRPIEIRID